MRQNVNVIGALVVAAGAVGAALWVGYSSFGGARTVRSASDAASAAQAEAEGGGPRRVERGGPPPGWVQQEEARSYGGEGGSFPPAGEAVQSFDTGALNLADRAEQDGALGTLGIGPRRGLIETYRDFFRPIIAGDAAAFESALVSMGADVGEPDEEGATRATALHDRLSGIMGGARVDLAAAEIAGRDATRPGEVPIGQPMAAGGGRGGDGPDNAIPMMVEMSVSVDEATGERSRNRMMVIPLATLFPEAAGRATEGATTVEVWAPAKLADGRGSDGDLGPSAFFVLDESSGRWQPVALRVALVSDAAASRLDDMVRARRRAQD